MFITFVSPIGQQRFTLDSNHTNGRAYILGRTFDFGRKGMILPSLAAVPGIMSSWKYDEIRSWSKLAVVHLGAFPAHLISASLQLVALAVNLFAATVLGLLSLVGVPHAERAARDFASGALISFDFLFLHLASSVYPGFFQLTDTVQSSP